MLFSFHSLQSMFLSIDRYWLDLCEEDVVLNVSDPGWAKGAWSSLYAPLLAGATAFIHQVKCVYIISIFMVCYSSLVTEASMCHINIEIEVYSTSASILIDDQLY